MKNFKISRLLSVVKWKIEDVSYIIMHRLKVSYLLMKGYEIYPSDSGSYAISPDGKWFHIKNHFNGGGYIVIDNYEHEKVYDELSDSHIDYWNYDPIIDEIPEFKLSLY